VPVKERYQNPVVGDSVTLRMFVLNRNNPADVKSVEKIDIYFADEAERTEANPKGYRLIQTVGASAVVQDDVGQYHVVLDTPYPQYVIGDYLDVWTVTFENEEATGTFESVWRLYPDMWYSSPLPPVYDFQFRFQPNRLRKGSKQYLRAEIVPHVPQAADLVKYYENLAIVASVKINIEQACGPCVPAESDLRLIVEDEPLTLREKRFAYYQIDTEDYDCGIYNVWFKLELGGNVFVSEKNQLQVFV
jgi:hypothetical protein